MTVSSISAMGNANPSIYQSQSNQRAQDFKALGSALQSGDLTSAQDAFATFLQDLQHSPRAAEGRPPFGRNTPAAKDFQTLQSALQSGHLTDAQKAFASLKQDLQAVRAHPHQHRLGTDRVADSTKATASAGNSTGTAVGGTLDVQV